MKTMKRKAILIAVFAVLSQGMTTAAAEASAAQGTVSATTEGVQSVNYKNTMTAIADAIRDKYPVATQAQSIADAIEQAADTEAFQNFNDGEEFRAAMNQLLWQTANDLHLKLHSAEDLAKRSKRTGARQPKVRQVVVQRDQGQNAGPREALGTTKIDSKMLDGNTGLVEITGPIYRNPDLFAEVLAKVSDADNIILDLRKAPGGSLPGVHYFSSIFFGEKTHLVSTVSRRHDFPRELWSDNTPLSELFADKSVYILTGKRTASGAEHIAYSFKETGRATLIGEVTAGAGNAGAFLSVGHGMQLFLPIMQTLSPKSGLPWEAKGVHPDIETTGDMALAKALSTIAEAKSPV